MNSTSTITCLLINTIILFLFTLSPLTFLLSSSHSFFSPSLLPLSSPPSFPSLFPLVLLLPPSCLLPNSVPPSVVPLAPGQEVIGNETGSATLSFRIDDAAPPVLLQGLRWFYAANFRINDPFAGQEITNLTNRTTESRLTFSDFTDMQYINLTVSNIVQQRTGIGGETDEGRYFIVATNPAGVNFNYIDLLVYGRYM